MTGAPKEIWARYCHHEPDWTASEELTTPQHVKYIRADIAELWMDMRYLEGHHAGLERAAAMLEDRASRLRDPNTYSLPAMPGKIICEDRAQTLERSAIDIRAAMEEDNE